MRTLLAIGIGAGDPEFVTIQAVNALNTVDVFFVFDKQGPGIDLSQARRAVCDRFIRDPHYRVVELADPSRDRAAAEYADAVRDWRDKRAELLERAIEAGLPDGGCGGVLVWGDPTLYDSTIRVFDTLVERGRVELDYQVIPGISSISALAARHRIPLNQVAAPVHVTTGRRLTQGLPAETDDILVMLDRADADLSCTGLHEQSWHIYWGAYLGTEHETLRSGPLAEVIDELPAGDRIALEDFGALVGLALALLGVAAAVLTGNGIWDGVGTVCIGVLLGAIAAILIVEMKSLLIGEGADAATVHAITEALEAGRVERVLHLRTQYLGPDELLVGAKIALTSGLSVADVANAIDDAEQRVRAVVPTARTIYLEPDLDRAGLRPRE